jgi:hypothetical protein
MHDTETAAEPQQSRGVDRVPEHLRTEPRETEWVHQHTDRPMAPYVNLDKPRALPGKRGRLARKAARR